MSKKVSLYILLGTIALIGVLFYKVIQPFVFSLLCAAVLAVLFRPVHAWATKICYGRQRVAAGLTTGAIVFAVFVPLAVGLVVAGAQLFDFSQEVVQLFESPDESEFSEEIEDFRESRLAQITTQYYSNLSDGQQSKLKDVVSKGANRLAKEVYTKTVGLVADVIQFLIGFVVMGLALYYFLADGDSILNEIRSLFPLGEEEKDALIDQFGKVCRGVVLGTLFAGLAQAALAGVGFALAGVPNVLLLIVITMFFSFVPLLGAGSVLLSVSLWLVFEGQYVAATCLFVYGMLIVGTVDNLIKAYLIGSEIKINPLVAMITVIGALQLVGLWGIFVGPMIAAFFYALLKILRERLKGDSRGEKLVTA